MDDKIKVQNKLSLLDQLLDDRCDTYGILNTIAYLFNSGLTVEEIHELGFELADIQYVYENPDAKFDGE